MQCGDPILCYSGKKRKIYRNWSMASTLIRVMAQNVFDCGKCLYCRRKRSQELAMRCVLHASLYDRNAFLTLTYDETHPNYHNELCYTDIQKFKKRLRRYFDYNYQKKIEIFNVHEYGKNGKKHWHLIAFNVDFPDKKLYTVKNGNNLYTSKTLEKMWSFGFVTIGDVSEASALYQAQYTQKDMKNGNTQNKKKSKSNHSGIGKKYFLENYSQILRLGYVPFQGSQRAIPRYFEKIAYRHWCHFNDRSAFFDLPDRKRLFSPFKNGEENRKMSVLYARYMINKKTNIIGKELEWKNNVIEPYLKTGKEPEFMQSLRNAVHDYNNKNFEEKF